MKYEDVVTYFIADAQGFVKIGKSIEGSIGDRFKALQCAHALPLTFLATTTESESACHVRFSSLHVRGEWFRVEPCLLDWLATHGDFEPLTDRVARTQDERFTRAYAAFSQQWTPRRLRELAVTLLREAK